MDRYLKRRWAKAQAYAQDDVQRWGAGYRVRSSKGGWYSVRVQLSTERKLVSAQCACPDHGQCTYNGVPVCKHTLAVANRLHTQTI